MFSALDLVSCFGYYTERSPAADAAAWVIIESEVKWKFLSYAKKNISKNNKIISQKRPLPPEAAWASAIFYLKWEKKSYVYEKWKLIMFKFVKVNRRGQPKRVDWNKTQDNREKQEDDDCSDFGLFVLFTWTWGWSAGAKVTRKPQQKFMNNSKSFIPFNDICSLSARSLIFRKISNAFLLLLLRSCLDHVNIAQREVETTLPHTVRDRDAQWKRLIEEPKKMRSNFTQTLNYATEKISDFFFPTWILFKISLIQTENFLS